MSENNAFISRVGRKVIKITAMLSVLFIVLAACSAANGGGGGNDNGENPAALTLSLMPASQSVIIGSSVSVTVRTPTAPTGDVTVMVTATPAGSSTAAANKPAMLNANISSAMVTFSTGTGNDLPTAGTYTISVTVTAGMALVTGSPTATILLVADTDGDSVADDDDAYPQNACATTNSDDDALPDTIFVPGEAGSPATCTAAEITALVADLTTCTDRASCTDPDDDNDGVNDFDADGTTPLDKFRLNACASTDTDDDGHPDMIAPVDTPATCTAAVRTALLSEMVGGIPLQEDNCPTASNPDQLNSNSNTFGDVCDPDKDGDNVLDHDALGIVDGTSMFNSMPVTADTPRDEFPLDASRSCNLDGMARVDGTTIGGPADTQDSEFHDCDNDSIKNLPDVDDDNDGLIEIATAAELNNVRHNLAGTSYDEAAADSGTGSDAGSSMGCLSGGCNGYELVADIDLATESSGMYANWVPIGGAGTSFNANFDGNGHSIVGLAINTGSGTRIGLFGEVGVSGSTTNLIIRNLHIAGTIAYTGSENQVRIGGLVGSVIDGTISNCSAAVNIIGGSGSGQEIGGLVGTSRLVENSWASGTVSSGSGEGAIGGLVGRTLGVIRNSFATGTVSGNALAGGGMGGLIGRTVHPLENSWASGAVTGGPGADVLSGLIGETSNGTTSAVYASGNVAGGEGSDVIGGLVGHLARLMENSYYSGTVDSAAGTATGTQGSLSTLPNVAGLTPAQLQGATAAGATISPAVVGTDMLACVAAGGTFTASAGGTPATCAGQATTVYVGWSTNNWHFGTASQWPALRSYKVNSSGTQIQGDLLCGQPAPRATRPECTGALVPLP